MQICSGFLVPKRLSTKPEGIVPEPHCDVLGDGPLLGALLLIHVVWMLCELSWEAAHGRRPWQVTSVPCTAYC